MGDDLIHVGVQISPRMIARCHADPLTRAVVFQSEVATFMANLDMVLTPKTNPLEDEADES